MGKLRPMTALYIVDGERILLLYRIGSKIADQSYIGCAGGHFEADEYNNARACVLRELSEETGLCADNLENMSLRYITMRLKTGKSARIITFLQPARTCRNPYTVQRENLLGMRLTTSTHFRCRFRQSTCLSITAVSVGMTRCCAAE